MVFNAFSWLFSVCRISASIYLTVQFLLLDVLFLQYWCRNQQLQSYLCFGEFVMTRYLLSLGTFSSGVFSDMVFDYIIFSFLLFLCNLVFSIYCWMFTTTVYGFGFLTSWKRAIFRKVISCVLNASRIYVTVVLCTGHRCQLLLMVRVC